MDAPLLEQLRKQTRPAHVALENQSLLKRLVSSQLNEAEYGQLLQAMLAFYQSLETNLIPATTALLRRHPDPHYRYLPRSPLLEADCRVLGLACCGCAYFPTESRLDADPAYLLGVLYVIEGSSQGGRLIARHLLDRFGMTADTGASYFHIHRWDHSWAAFRRWLSGELEYCYRDDTKSIIAGANMTFSALHTHLDQWQLLTHER